MPFIVQNVWLQDIWLLREAGIPSVFVGFLLTLVVSRSDSDRVT